MSVSAAPPPVSPAPDPARKDGPTAEEIQVPELEWLDRGITGVITFLPPLLLVLAGWRLWNNHLHLYDLAILAVMYTATALGVTVGFHRLFTHRSFKTKPWRQGRLRGARHDVDRGAADLVGCRSPQAPRLLRPPR